MIKYVSENDFRQAFEDMGYDSIETLDDLKEATRVIMLDDGEAFICEVDF